MKKKNLFLLSMLFISTILYGCGTQTESSAKPEQKASEKLKIYTTIYPLQDFTKKIGGEHVDVVSVFPTGVDAHTYEPTAKTMVEIAEADALIYTGAGVEGFVEAANKALQNEDVMVVKAVEGIELLAVNEHEEEHQSEGVEEEHHEENEHEHHSEGTEEEHHEEDHNSESHSEEEHHHGDVDPHVWLDPVLAIDLAENILHSLEQLKPEAKEDFQNNFDKLVEELQVLDQEFKSTVENASKKEILVSHAAYGYWESRYGIKQISVSGLSPTNEPSQKELETIIHTAKEHNIKYVIFEQNLSTKIAEMVKREINAEALTLHNLEAITESDQKNGYDYFDIMRKNLETLEKALQ